MSHTIELEVSGTEATPVSARLCVDPAAPGAKTTTAATPTSVNPARKSWMMRTGSPLTELLGHELRRPERREHPKNLLVRV
jgi:hypothetical protein